MPSLPTLHRPTLLALVFLALPHVLSGAPASAQTATATATETPTPTATATSTLTPTAGATATTTTTPTPSSGVSFIGGTVYIDENVDQIFNSKEKTKDDVSIVLQPSSAVGTSSSKSKTKTDNDGFYSFKNLGPGVYLITIDLPDGYVSTSGEQLEVRVNGLDGTNLANFGIFKSANVSGSSLASSSSSSSGGSLTSGSSVVTVYQSPTATPTATATPTLTPIQKLRALPPIRSARFYIEGRADDNGLLYDYAAEGSVLQPGDLDMDAVVNANPVDLVVLGSQAYLRPTDAETWTSTSSAAIRSWYGILSALDVIMLPYMDKLVMDVRPTSLVERIDRETVRRVDVVLSPSVGPGASAPAGTPGSASTGSSSAPSGISVLFPSAGIQPQLRPDPGVSISTPVPIPAGASTQLQVLDGVVELWVSVPNGLVQAAHLKLHMPSARQDYAGRLEPVAVDAWVWYSEHNESFTVAAPTSLTPPTPAPALATAIARATDDARSSTSAGPIPVPVRGGSSSAPPPVGQSGGEPEPQPKPVTVGTPEPRNAAAERALLALASASGPRTGSKITTTGIMLDVPWRGVSDSSGAILSTDGPAAVGMILDAFGITAPTADLQALADRWQEARASGEPVSIDTLVRIAERGSLRPIGTGRGPGGGDWTSVMARDFLRRGYPVLALVRPQVLTDGAVDPSGADRFIVIVGYEGDDLIYHDPANPEGASRRVDSVTLDQAWVQATPPRQGVVFGFGASVIGLLDGPGRSQQVRPDPTATATSVAVRVLPTAPVIEPEPAPEPPGSGGVHPALLAFLGILAGGVGFLIARLYR